MIGTLKGIISEKSLDKLILEVNGVGYELFVCASEHSSLSLNDETKLYVYENIREDAHDLYGFTSLDSKNLFEQLISVKNVGPKVGLAIMSIDSPANIRSAIAGGDVARLTTAKGVGKRAAEQLVVELRDKVGLVSAGGADDVIFRGGINPSDEAVQALLALGYNETDAATALVNVDPTLPVSERVKQALKGVKK